MTRVVSCNRVFKFWTRRMCLCCLGSSEKKKNIQHDCSPPFMGISVCTESVLFAVVLHTFCSCTGQICLNVINYSCVFLSLTVRKAVSTVSERLSLPPAGWKYGENCEVSESVCLSHLLTELFYQCTFLLCYSCHYSQLCCTFHY